MACEPQTLVTSTPCQFSCLSGKMLSAIRIRLLCAIIDGQTMACDAQTLVDAAKCIENCVPAGMMASVEIYLLCQIANNGISGGSSSSGVTCGISNPVAAPSGSCGLFYRTDNGAVWVWTGAAWLQIIAP